jgi:hypothetical protein
MFSPAPLSSLRIRRATPEDAAVCGRMFYQAFANINQAHGFAPELPGPEAGIQILGLLFSHPSFNCVVGEEDGQVVGSNCLDERSQIARLGPITVYPAAQDRGVGR